MVNLPLSGNSFRVKVPSSPVVVLTLGSSFTRITVPMRGSPVLLSLTIPSSVCAWMEVVAAARSAALSKNLFIYIAIEIFIRFFSQKSSFYFFTFKTVWMIFPSLSIIDILSCFLSAVNTEKPSAGLQNTVPSIGFTGRARDEEELTT